MIHAADTEAGVAVAMGQADLRVGAGIHHPAEDEGNEGDSLPLNSVSENDWILLANLLVQG
jgi:hypothetical protein